MRAIISVGLAAACGVASAQCGITMALTGSFQCPGPGSTLALNINGGVPPLSVVLQQFGQSNDVINGLGTPASVSVGSLLVPEDGQVTVVVTDGSGCVQQAALSYQATVYLVPVITTTYVCSSGATLRWNGQFTGSVPSYTSPCPSTFSYSIAQSINSLPPLVPITSGWTQENPSSWLWGSPLPQGSSYVVIAPGVIERTCQSKRECYGPQNTGNILTDPGDCGTNFRLRAALDGALPSGTLMSDALRTMGLLPLGEPYSALGYAYTGSTPGTTITAAQVAVSGDNAIVDWVIVEVRSSSTPSQVLYSKAALLQRDGDVVDADGSSYVNCPLAPGSYRVAIKHRNHLGVMTATAQNLALDPASTLVDFRLASTGTYGSNAEVLKNTIYCLWTGDATGNGTVSYSGAANDRDPILVAVGGSTPNNALNNVYDRRDTNMDGVIKYTGTNNDRDIILTNVGSTTPNSTRTQQLP